MGLSLSQVSWTEVPLGPLILFPVGSTEQHGPHLPFDVDTTIATAVGSRLAAVVGEPAVLVPALSYGASGEHQDFPGTISMGHEALRLVLIEVVRSLATWAGRIVFVNGHGGNIATLASVVRQMRAESHDVAWLPCVTPSGDAHAGYVETAIMLHLAPDRVRLDRAEAGVTEPLANLMGVLRARGVRAVSPNGVLGDPLGANGVSGAILLQEMVDSALSRLIEGNPDTQGMLQVAERGR